MRILQYTVSRNGIKDSARGQLPKERVLASEEYGYAAQALQPDL
jgi:hypothetical protein